MNPHQLRARVLMEWRGLPEFPLNPPPTAKPIGDAVTKYLGSLGLADRLREEQVSRCWLEIVGDFVGRHSAPHRLREGALTVRVLQPTLRYELDRVWKKDILAKLQARFGKRVIREVKFQIG